jgi:hypothetical protein
MPTSHDFSFFRSPVSAATSTASGSHHQRPSVPVGTRQQVLHPIRGGVPGVLGDCPAVPARQGGQPAAAIRYASPGAGLRRREHRAGHAARHDQAASRRAITDQESDFAGRPDHTYRLLMTDAVALGAIAIRKRRPSWDRCALPCAVVLSASSVHHDIRPGMAT